MIRRDSTKVDQRTKNEGDKSLKRSCNEGVINYVFIKRVSKSISPFKRKCLATFIFHQFLGNCPSQQVYSRFVPSVENIVVVLDLYTLILKISK